MKEYLFKEENIKKLQDFCDKHGISKEKVLQSPKCYSKDMMVIQHRKSSDDKGLNDSVVAKILLTIKKTSEGIVFEPSEDIKEYLV